MGRHPMGEGVDPNPRILAERLVDPDALVMGKTAENLHDRYPTITKERADAYAVRSQAEDRRGVRRRASSSGPGAGRDPLGRGGLGAGHDRRAAAARDHHGVAGRR